MFEDGKGGREGGRGIREYNLGKDGIWLGKIFGKGGLFQCLVGEGVDGGRAKA